MIGIAQRIVISITVVLTGFVPVIAYGFITEPATMSWTVILTVGGLTFGGWIAISSWKDLKFRSKQ